MKTNLTAENRSALWETLRYIAQEWKHLIKKGCQELTLTMSCGRVYTFIAFDDIPKRSLICGCGEEYVIKYKEAEPYLS